MYNKFKIVCLTPAGRRRYMKYLIPQVLASDIVDRYDIWVNTTDKEDICFFEQLSKKYRKLNLVWQPDGIVNGIQSINAFYKKCIDEDTIYFKLDDDIIWMEPDLIQKMVAFRVSNPQYFLVSPMVINNALCTYILQVNNLLYLREYCCCAAIHPVFSLNGKFAVELHKWFLDRWLTSQKYENLHSGKHEFSMTRFSINAILWFGTDMKKFNGIVTGDDEEFLSCLYPTSKGMSNCINGDILAAHFAFFTQRAEVDRAHILEQYGDYLKKLWNESDGEESEVFNDIQRIIDYIQSNKLEIQNMPSRYRSVSDKKPKFKKKFKACIKAILPYGVVNKMSNKNTDWIL